MNKKLLAKVQELNRGYGDVVEEYTVKEGIELLDHYAAHALSGMVSAGYPKDSIVNEAFKLAERMLEARGEYL